jgi:hypothetical protein
MIGGIVSMVEKKNCSELLEAMHRKLANDDVVSRMLRSLEGIESADSEGDDDSMQVRLPYSSFQAIRPSEEWK